MEQVASTPRETNSRAVVYSLKNASAVAVTADDFTTRRVIAVPMGTTVHAADGSFVIAEGWNGARLRIVDAAGMDQEVAVSGAASPVAPGELPIGVELGNGARLVAVNVGRAEAHRVPAPPVVQHHAVRVSGGRLAVLSTTGRRSTYHWSDDGGATWERAPLQDSGFSMVVPTPAGEPHFVVEGADGATLFPLVAVHEMRAGGGFTRSPYDDGGVFTSVTSPFLWGDEMRMFLTRGGRPPYEAGLYRYESGESTEIATDLPETIGRPEVHLDGIVGADDTALWLASPDGPLYRSIDGGETWEKVAGR